MDVLDLVNDTNQVGPGHDFLVRPFVCKYDACDRAFARKSDLARHFRIHTNERPFVCVYRGCGKAFIQRSALTVHTRVHTGERPHHCETCNKAFADSSSLARHRRIHTGKRPYGCKVAGCGRQFARRNTYLKHFKRQHPELPPPTSSSVRALHIPTFRGQQGYLSGSVPGSAADSNDYGTSPTSTPHPFSATHPSEAYPYNGGFVVGGMLHSSQLAPSPGPHSANHILRPYFHPSHAEQAQGHPGHSLSHPGSNGEAHQVNQVQDGNELHNNGGLGYDSQNGNGHIGLNQEYEQPVFAYPPGENPLSRVQSNPVIGSNGGFYFKHEMRYQDPNVILPQGTGNWGGVGGGFNPSQIALPNAVPYYQGTPTYPQQAMGVKLEQPKESSSERGSPDLVDINAPNTAPVKFQQPYQMVFNGVSHMPSPVQNGQLHAVPAQMQRFHSAPILPTSTNNWPQSEFKATTPGYNDRHHAFRRPVESWDQADANRETTTDDKESKEWEAPPVYPSVPGVRVNQNQNQNQPQPQSQAQTPSQAQFRYQPNGQNSAPLLNIQTPSSLPPMNIFPQQPYYTQQGWNAPKELANRPIYTQEDVASPPKIMINQDRQMSGVSSVGLGLANVNFDEGEGSGEEDDKPWTPSDSGSEGEGEDELDSTEEADDSDDEFVLGQKPKRKGKKRTVRRRVVVA